MGVEELHGGVSGFDLETRRWGCVVERSRAYIVEDTSGEEERKAIALVPGSGLGLRYVQCMDKDAEAVGQDRWIETCRSVVMGRERNGVCGNAGWNGGRIWC